MKLPLLAFATVLCLSLGRRGARRRHRPRQGLEGPGRRSSAPGAALPAPVGARLQSADVVTTGSDGSVGITMNDDSLLSAGSNSRLALDRFVHDPATNQGRFNVSLNRGTLAVISGRIAKQSPDAMTVRTPAAILGVRGTEFAVRVGD